MKYIKGINPEEDCWGENKKLINGYCETGNRVNDGSYEIRGGRWICTYHYEFSDGSTNGPFDEMNMYPCAISFH